MNNAKHISILLAAAAILLATSCSRHTAPKDTKTKRPVLVEPNVRVGEVENGMTRDEVESTLGKAKAKDNTTSYYKGMFVLFHTNGVLFNVKCVKAFGGVTKEGIGIRSTRAEVIKAYGDPDDDKKADNGDETLWYSSLNISFFVQRGKVTSFIVHF